MTDKLSKQQVFTETMIRLERLEAKVDRILKLLEGSDHVNVIGGAPGHGASWVGIMGHIGADAAREFNCTPPQWPNESRTDYMKRIGQYNEASSLNEQWDDDYK